MKPRNDWANGNLQSRTDWVSSLHHEALDVAVEDAAIVESTGRQGQEVLYIQTQRQSLHHSLCSLPEILDENWIQSDNIK